MHFGLRLCTLFTPRDYVLELIQLRYSSWTVHMEHHCVYNALKVEVKLNYVGKSTWSAQRSLIKIPNAVGIIGTV